MGGASSFPARPKPEGKQVPHQPPRASGWKGRGPRIARGSDYGAGPPLPGSTPSAQEQNPSPAGGRASMEEDERSLGPAPPTPPQLEAGALRVGRSPKGPMELPAASSLLALVPHLCPQAPSPSQSLQVPGLPAEGQGAAWASPGQPLGQNHKWVLL